MNIYLDISGFGFQVSGFAKPKFSLTSIAYAGGSEGLFHCLDL